MGVAFLIVSLLCANFAWAFLLAAVLLFAAHDQEPLAPATDRLLTWLALTGGGWLVTGHIVCHRWRDCPQARRFAYAGVVCGIVAALTGWLAVRSAFA